MKQFILQPRALSLPTPTVRQRAVHPYATALLLIVFMIAPCHGELIDDFTTAQVNPSNGLRDAVSGPGILGTERDIILDDDQAVLVIENGMATYRAFGSGGIILEWDGIQGGDGSPDRARELPITDFTQGGLNDRFVVDIVALTGDWSVSIFVTSGSTAHTSRTLLGHDSTGALEIPFIDFAAPEYLQEANGISLRLNPSSSGQSVTVGGFRAVPEPSSWFLLAVAGVALVSYGRTSRRRR